MGCQPSTQINEVPYEETQQVLDNVENLIKDAEGKFENPNIDLSILPPINLDNKDVIEESSSTTTTQSTVILSVTTVKNAVMDVVITPDTSSVEGTTLVVEKIKEIIDDIVRQENSGEDIPISDNGPNVSDDDNGNLDDEGSIENTIDALPRENIAGSSTVNLGSEFDKGDKFTTETTTVTSSKPVTTEKEKPMTISTTEVSSIPVDLVLN